MLSFILGAVVLLIVIGALIFSFLKTPNNLTGFYGLFYFLIAIGGFIGGIALMIGAFL